MKPKPWAGAQRTQFSLNRPLLISPQKHTKEIYAFLFDSNKDHPQNKNKKKQEHISLYTVRIWCGWWWRRIWWNFAKCIIFSIKKRWFECMSVWQAPFKSNSYFFVVSAFFYEQVKANSLFYTQFLFRPYLFYSHLWKCAISKWNEHFCFVALLFKMHDAIEMIHVIQNAYLLYIYRIHAL